MKHKVCGYFCLLLWLLPVVVVASDKKPLRFGSVAMDSPAVMQQRLLPLTNYLGAMLKRPVVLKLSTSMSGAINSLVSDEVDFAFLTPVAYVDAHNRSKVQIAVRTVIANQPWFKLMIVVRDDSPIHKVEELTGKRFAFGDPAALLQRAVVVGAGMPLARLGKYDFVDHYDNVVRGVLMGDYDAGIVLDNTAAHWQNNGIRVLYASQALPPYNIAASASLDHDTVMKIREALLKLDPSNSAHRQVIAALGDAYTGFASVRDKDYDIVRKLIKPFRK